MSTLSRQFSDPHTFRVEQLEPRILLSADGAAPIVVDMAIPSGVPSSAGTGETITWDSASGGNWSDAANWDLGRVPEDGDSVIIEDLAGDQTITYDVGEVSLSAIDSEETIAVTGGVLSVDGTLATPELNIANGGTVTVEGTVDGNVINSGTFSPGAAVETAGTTSVTGTFVNTASGTLLLEIADSTTADALSVSQQITVAGTLDFNLIGPAPPLPVSFSFVTTSVSISGTFDTIDAPASLSPTVGSTSITGDTSFTLAESVDSALNDLESQFGDWLGLFNLSTFGADSLSLPVLADSLSDLFDLDTFSLDLGDFLGDANVSALVTSLESAGFEVNSIFGGFTDSGRDIPASSGSVLIELSYSNILSAGLSSDPGDNFDDSTEGVLQGLSDSPSLDGTLDLLASLSLDLVFGLDADGIFISSGAVLLALAGAGSLSGSGTLGGKNSSLSGTGSVDLDVQVNLDNSGGDVRLVDIPGNLTTVFVPTASGTATLDLSATVGTLSLDFTGTYSLNADLVALSVDQSLALALTGTLELPGFEDASGMAAAISITGAYDSGADTWTLTGDASGITLLGFSLNSASFSVDFAPGDFSGSASASMTLDFFESGSSPINLAISTTFDDTAITIDANANIDSLALNGGGGDTLFSLTTASLDLSLTGDMVANTLSGTLDFAAGSALFNPNQTDYTASVTDGDDADSDALTGSFDFSGDAFSLTVDQLDIAVAGVFTLSASGAAIAYQREEADASKEIASIASAQLEITAFLPSDGGDPLTFSLSDISVRQNGFSVGNASFSIGESISVGDALTIVNPELSVSGLDYTAGSAPTGTFELSAANATLFEGSSTSATVTTVSGGFDLESKAFSLTLGSLEMNADGVFDLSASDIAFGYDPAGDSSQEVASVSSVGITILALESADGTQPSFTLDNLSVRLDGFSLGQATFTYSENIVVGGVLTVVNPSVTLTDVNYTIGGSVSGTFGIGADSASLFEGGSSSATVTTIQGSFDLNSKAFSLGFATLEVNIEDTFVVTGSSIDFNYDPTGPPDQTIVSVASVTASLPALNVSGTVTDLVVGADASFQLASLSLDTAGLAESLGIASFLPFTINGIEVVFGTTAGGKSDFTSFTLSVSGAFNFDAMGDLPFTPILTIGTSELSEDGVNTFDFTIAIDNGEVVPIDLGPITIGFSDLSVGSTAVLSGSITLGGYQNGVFVTDFGGSISLESDGELNSVVGGAGISISGSFDADSGILDVAATLSVSFNIGDNVSVTDASLDFAMEISTAGNAPQLDSLSLEGANVSSVVLDFNSIMSLEATGVSLNFNPGAGQNIAEFASLSATFPSLAGFTGTALNFGIGSNGDLVALDGFGVDLSLPGFADIKWPDWLPIEISELAVVWPDFNNNPFDFSLIFSATVSGLHGLSNLSFTGSLEGVVIDIGDLIDGKFPITSFASIGVGIEGDLFGGTIEMDLFLAILRFDADGNVIDNSDLVTPVAEKVLYGGITGGFTTAAGTGFQARFGLSELGPLQGYVEVDSPQVLEPISGLAITGFRAGVTFNTTLPSITDPKELDSDAFKPQNELSLEEWQDLLTEAVINQQATSTGSFLDAFSQPMRFEGGATLFSIYASENAFRADIDILFDTEGRFLIDAVATFGNSLSLNMKFYADLSNVGSGSGTLLFLSELPSDDPVLTFYGSIQFLFGGSATGDEDNPAGEVQIIITGGVDMDALGLATLTIEGTLTLTFLDQTFTADLDGRVSLSLLGDLLEIEGTLTIDSSGSGTAIWGVLTIVPDFSDLESLGIFASGNATFRLNTTDTDITETLTLFGSEEDFLLQAETFSVIIDGSVTFQNGGSDWFYFDGLFAMQINNSGLDVLLTGSLTLGEADDPILEFSVLAYMAIRSSGFAAEFSLSLSTNFPASWGVSLSGSFLLRINTTGTTQSFTIPAGFIEGQGAQTFSVSGGINSATGSAYLIIEATDVNLTIQGISMTGSLDIEVSTSEIIMQASLSFSVHVGGRDLMTFSVSGGFLVNQDGLAAALDLSLSSNAFSDFGFGLSGSFVLQINTINQQVSFSDLGINLPAGPYFLIQATGSLTILSETLSGSFTFEITSSQVSLTVSASMSVVIGGTTLFSFNISGGITFYGGNHRGIAAVFTASLGTNGSSDFDFSLGADASFTIALNTTNRSRTVAGTSITASTFFLDTSTSFTVGGFQMNGTFTFILSSNSITITASASLDLFGATFSISGDFFLNNQGVALSIDVSVDVISSSIMTIRGTFTLNINTTNSTRFGIAAGSAEFSITGAKVSFIGITLSGSISISSSGLIDIPSSDPLTLSILGQTASLSGYVNFSTGYFNLTGTINISLGSRSVAQISGSMSITVFRERFGWLTLSGVHGTMDASLRVFNISIMRLSSSVSIASDGTFSFSVSASFTIASIVNASGSFSISIDSSRRMSVSFSGSFNVFNRFKGSFSGAASSKTGRWWVSGSATISMGNDNLGAKVTFSAYLSNFSGFSTTVSGSAWARVRILKKTIGIEGSFSASIGSSGIATLRVSGRVCVIICASAHKTIHMNFKTGRIYLSDIGDATVFLDVNGNGELDDGEPFTITNDVGEFDFLAATFNEDDDALATTLGALSIYDTNQNGVLDATEGQLLVTGGTDIDTGESNPDTAVLDDSLLTQNIGLVGATVFWDANLNGQLDAGEFEVITDENGSFTFVSEQDETEAAKLGSLAAYDLDGDGQISEDEGLFYAEGGTSVTTGEANDGVILLVDATEVGDSGLVGGLIFLDANSNGVWDEESEPSTYSHADGHYTFRPEDKESHQASLGYLSEFDSNGNGVIDPEEGSLVRLGGELIGDEDERDVNLHFDANEPRGYLIYSDAVVFLDLNGNGLLDSGETSTMTDEAGFYSFLTGDEISSDLGELEAFDTNGNGIIDLEEGSFVSFGGIDNRTGTANTETVISPASLAGSGFNNSTTHITHLLYDLMVNRGYSQIDGEEIISDALGFVPGTSPLNIIPIEELADFYDGTEYTFNEDEARLLAQSSKLSTVNITIDQLIEILRPDLTPVQVDDIVTTAINDILIDAVENDPNDDQDIYVDENGEFNDRDADLDLTQADTVRAILARVEELAGVDIDDEFANGMAITLANINALALAYFEAETLKITTAFARLKILMQTVYFESAREAFLQQIPASEFVDRFTGDNLLSLLNTFEIAAENEEPLIEAANQLEGPSTEPLVVDFQIFDLDGLSSLVEVAFQDIDGLLVDFELKTEDGVNYTLTLFPRTDIRTAGQLEIRADDLHVQNSEAIQRIDYRILPIVSAEDPRLVLLDGALFMEFDISLDAPATFDVFVDYNIGAQSAVGPDTSESLTGSASFAAGQQSQTLAVPFSYSNAVRQGGTQLDVEVLNQDGAAIRNQSNLSSFTYNTDEAIIPFLSAEAGDTEAVSAVGFDPFSIDWLAIEEDEEDEEDGDDRASSDDDSLDMRGDAVDVVDAARRAGLNPGF